MNNFENNRKNKEEINLADWIRIFLKEKKLVFAFALSGLLLGGLLSFVLPVVYKAETFIETITLNSAQLTEEIKAGFYGDSGNLKVNRPEGTNLVRIETSSSNPKQALKILKNLNSSVIEISEQKREKQKKFEEENLKDLEEKVNFLIKKGKEVEVLEAEIYKAKKGFSLPSVRVAKKPDIFAKKELSLKTGLLLGFFLGLFLSLIWVSIREWWRENEPQINKLE